MKNFISDDFSHGDNLSLGKGVIIEPKVRVGKNVTIGHRVTLKSGTIMLDDSVIDDHCITTGACFIGNSVNIRTGAIISRSTIIEDCCFIGPGVITNHTKNVTHAREHKVKDEQLLTYIGFGSIIGSQASLLAGLYIEPQTIIGGGAVVVKDLPGKCIYVGSPCKKVSDVPSHYIIDEAPDDSGVMYLTSEILEFFKGYMPNINLDKYLNLID